MAAVKRQMFRSKETGEWFAADVRGAMEKQPQIWDGPYLVEIKTNPKTKVTTYKPVSPVSSRSKPEPEPETVIIPPTTVDPHHDTSFSAELLEGVDLGEDEDRT